MEAAFSIREMLLEGVGFLRDLFAEGGQDEKSSDVDVTLVTMKQLEDLAHEVHRKCREMKEVSISFHDFKGTESDLERFIAVMDAFQGHCVRALEVATRACQKHDVGAVTTDEGLTFVCGTLMRLSSEVKRLRKEALLALNALRVLGVLRAAMVEIGKL
jgi:metal-dependent HD superfamily phosphatase/phosphodiesterase